MKKFSLNTPAKDLDGNESIQNGQVVKLGKILANALVTQPKGDPIKFYHWAVSLQQGKDIVVDESDFDLLKNWIKASETIYVISKAQILEILSNATNYVAPEGE